MKLFASLLMVAVAGCSSAGTTMTAPQNVGGEVRMVGSPGAITGCEFITQVRGDQNMYGGFLFRDAAEADATKQLQEKTRAVGGNTLYMVASNVGDRGANLVGDAYRCPA